MLPQRLVVPLATLAVVAVPLIATTANAMPKTIQNDAAGALSPHSVLAFNQQAQGNSVNVAYVHLPTDGYVAIYGSDDAGKRTGKALGYVALTKGDHRNIAIELANAPKPGTSLWASLYQDVDGDKKLDVSKDTPFWKDLPHENRFEVNG